MAAWNYAADFGKRESTIAWQLQLHCIALLCSFETAAAPLAIAPDKSSHCIICIAARFVFTRSFWIIKDFGACYFCTYIMYNPFLPNLTSFERGHHDLEVCCSWIHTRCFNHKMLYTIQTLVKFCSIHYWWKSTFIIITLKQCHF